MLLRQGLNSRFMQIVQACQRSGEALFYFVTSKGRLFKLPNSTIEFLARSTQLTHGRMANDPLLHYVRFDCYQDGEENEWCNPVDLAHHHSNF